MRGGLEPRGRALNSLVTGRTTEQQCVLHGEDEGRAEDHAEDAAGVAGADAGGGEKGGEGHARSEEVEVGDLALTERARAAADGRAPPGVASRT
jgi:hypothetical protein